MPEVTVNVKVYCRWCGKAITSLRRPAVQCEGDYLYCDELCRDEARAHGSWRCAIRPRGFIEAE